MQINILFVTLVFVVIIIIAQHTNLLITLGAILAIINLLVYLAETNADVVKLIIKPTNLMESTKKQSSDPVLVPAQEQPAGLATAVNGVDSVDIYADRILDPYGQFYDTHQAYNNLLRKPAQLPIAASCGERVAGVDAESARIALQRERNKRATDGAVSKTADYYAYNYAEELDQAETKVWWGNYDI